MLIEAPKYFKKELKFGKGEAEAVVETLALNAEEDELITKALLKFYGADEIKSIDDLTNLVLMDMKLDGIAPIQRGPRWRCCPAGPR